MRGERLQTANRIAKRLWEKYHGPSKEHRPDDEYPATGRYRKTKVFCSSPFCCGNPRRMRGQKNLTRQELKALLSEQEEF